MQPLRARVNLGAMTIKGSSYSPKLRHFWSLTIRLFSVISRTLFGGVSSFCREAVGVFSSSSRLGQRALNIVLNALPSFIYVESYLLSFIYVESCSLSFIYVKSHPSAEKQSVYSATPADWASVRSISCWTRYHLLYNVGREWNIQRVR